MTSWAVPRRRALTGLGRGLPAAAAALRPDGLGAGCGTAGCDLRGAAVGSGGGAIAEIGKGGRQHGERWVGPHGGRGTRDPVCGHRDAVRRQQQSKGQQASEARWSV